VRGLWIELAIAGLSPSKVAADPAIAALGKHLKRAKLRRDAEVVVQRAYLDAESGHEVGPTAALSGVAEVRLLANHPRLVRRVLVAPESVQWASLWEQLGYRRIESCSFEDDGRRFALWELDLEGLGGLRYLRAVYARTLVAHAEPERGQPVSAADVRAALRSYADTLELACSSLAASPLVLRRAGPGATATERAAAVRALLRDEVEAMAASVRGRKWQEAVVATYLDPPAPQEQIAERLGLPFRTYRDHLVKGIEVLADRLQARERADSRVSTGPMA
jgi:hypothetical protein